MLEANITVPSSQRIEIRQFKGFTDSECCPPGWFNEIENLHIEDDGSLCQRWGSEILCPDTPLTSQGNMRVEHLACFKGKLLIFQGKRVSCKAEDGTISVIEGLKDSDLLNEADATSCSDSDYFNEHMLIVDDACSNPSKIYCDEDGNLTAKTMGLPGVAGDVTADTYVSYWRIPGDGEAPNGLTFFYSHTTNACEYVPKIAGSMDGDGDPVAEQTKIPIAEELGFGSVLFAVFYCCKYTTQSGTEFLDYGPVTYLSAKFIKPGSFTDRVAVNDQQWICLEGIEPFTCPDGTQYDEDNIELHVYRTAINGTTFFELGTFPASTTELTFSVNGQPNPENPGKPVADFQWTLDDLSIGLSLPSGGSIWAVNEDGAVNNQVIYNQGSSIQWTAAPASSFIEVIDDVAWYAGRTCVDGEEFNNRLYQSIPGAPWSVPREFYVEFEGEIIGLSQYSRFPIVSVIDDCGHCQLYRVEGRLDIFGRDQLVPYVIADVTSSINNRSFVKAESGLYFLGFGGSGVYRTDGYRVEKVPDPNCNFDETYCRMIETEIQRKNAYGVYDKYRNRIYWGVTTDPALTENNKYLVYHEHHNAFTWDSSGDNFQPSASIYDEKKLIRGDGRGYIFVHDEDKYTDPTVAVGTPANEWGTTRIPFCLKTTPYDFGDCLTNKQVQKIFFQGKPETDTTFKIESFDNGCDTPTDLKQVEFKTDDNCHMYASRQFPCKSAVTKSKAIRVCSTSAVIECGTEAADFIVWNPLENSLARQDATPFTNDDIGNTICVDGQEVIIENIIFGGKALVTLDPKPAAGNFAWAMKGFPKNERFCLNCVGFVYCLLGEVGGEFSVGTSKTAQWEQFLESSS